jgi:ATP-dependent protease ClpP protease subunit
MHEHSEYLIHALSTTMWGNINQLHDDMSNADNLMKKIGGIYLGNSKLTKEELDEIFKHDLFYDAQKCLELGLVDNIL